MILIINIMSVFLTHGNLSPKMIRFFSRIAFSLVCLGGLASLQAVTYTYDSWAAVHFVDVLDAEAAPGADPDTDGIANLREYAFDLDPNVADVSPEEGGILEFEGSHYLFVRFPRRTDALDLRFEVRAKDRVSELCDGTKPYDWVMGSSANQPGLVSTDTSTNPPTVTIRDHEAPLESNVFRGFLQLFLVLDGVEHQIDFVTVGDPDNPADITGFGAVSTEFEMGECEITNDQYAEFLNAVASEDDWVLVDGFVENLFFSSMESSSRGGIRRHGEPGSYSYSVKPLMGDKPVIYVSFLSACRYCNWLHNGKPRPRCRRMVASTTEDGAYDLTALAGGGWTAPSQIVRKPGATYFLPSEDEWYKGAYYEPMRSSYDPMEPISPSNTPYWTYGTRSDDLPVPALAKVNGDVANGSQGNVTNYLRGAEWDSNQDGNVEGAESGNVTTVASGGPLNESYYGISDIEGNAAEWTEGKRSTWARIQRGTSWNYSNAQIGKDWRYFQHPVQEVENSGIRVARRLP